MDPSTEVLMIQRSVRLSVVKGPPKEELLQAQRKGLSVSFTDVKGQKHKIFPRKVSPEAGSTGSFIFSYETSVDNETLCLEGYCDYRGGSLRGWVQIPEH